MGQVRKYLSKKIRAEVLAKTESRCWFCGLEIAPLKKTYTLRTNIEHLMPVSRGGGDEIANLVPACFGCNSSKKDRTLEEFRSHLNGDESIRDIWWWAKYIADDLEKVNWYCRGEMDDELFRYVMRVQAYLRTRRVVFYGECLGCDPNNYCI